MCVPCGCGKPKRAPPLFGSAGSILAMTEGGIEGCGGGGGGHKLSSFHVVSQIMLVRLRLLFHQPTTQSVSASEREQLNDGICSPPESLKDLLRSPVMGRPGNQVEIPPPEGASPGSSSLVRVSSQFQDSLLL